MQYRRKYGLDERAIVLLFCGRFEKVKGILEFCEAVKKLLVDGQWRIEVTVVGTGSLQIEVKSITGGKHGIHSFGLRPEEKLHEFHIAADIFMIPSRFEGMPLTVLEATNFALPIVFSPVGGIPEILEQYPTKTLLKEVSFTEVYRTLSNVISGDLGLTPRALAYAKTFDWKYTADKSPRYMR